MGRRTSLASLAGGPVEDVPGQTEPTFVRFPVTQLLPTPLNPRNDFGTTEQLTELGESMRRRQLQPVVVVSRAAYLKAFPEHADAVGEVSHVIVNGERRYRAAIHVGLHSLEAVIREEVASTRQQFLDAVLSENIDRKNFDPIEEARGVEAMVAECGSATMAAEQFKRTSAWVSQRRVLLKLIPELQEQVSQRLVPLREAREWGRLPADQQQAVFEAWRDERAAPKRIPQQAADNTDQLPGPEPAHSQEKPPAPLRNTEPETAPDKRETARTSTVPPMVALLWTNPEAVNRLVRQHMTGEDRVILAKLLQD